MRDRLVEIALAAVVVAIAAPGVIWWALTFWRLAQ
jgi:hypothetical protein